MSGEPIDYFFLDDVGISGEPISGLDIMADDMSIPVPSIMLSEFVSASAAS